eukprot:TRINITY_DN14655_c0_g1_i1.p1 TRINITY_DN14655_c0_g1~~TRINITY_DN14655_c0_g1_i1.p1  ORF type:complete len:1678 (+),score=232.16 TRINITY_DN14655_c0_g1_i1:81-5036(+)
MWRTKRLVPCGGSVTAGATVRRIQRELGGSSGARAEAAPAAEAERLSPQSRELLRARLRRILKALRAARGRQCSRGLRRALAASLRQATQLRSSAEAQARRGPTRRQPVLHLSCLNYLAEHALLPPKSRKGLPFLSAIASASAVAPTRQAARALERSRARSLRCVSKGSSACHAQDTDAPGCSPPPMPPATGVCPTPTRPLAAAGSNAATGSAGMPAGGGTGGGGSSSTHGSGGGGGPGGSGGGGGAGDSGPSGGNGGGGGDHGTIATADASGSAPLRIRFAGMNESAPSGVSTEVGQRFNTPIPAAEVGIQPPAGTEVSKISCGAFFVLMLTTQGAVLHAGANNVGQRGIGTIDHDDHPDLVSVALPEPAVDIAAGLWHSVAVLSSGKAYSWGCNDDFRLGRRGNGTRPSAVQAITEAELVYSGTMTNFFRCRGREWYGCGHNDSGLLCLGHNRQTAQVQRIPALCGRDIVQFKVGDWHAVMLEADGTVSVWGKMSSMSGGGMTADCSDVWTEARGSSPAIMRLPPVVKIASGYHDAGAITVDGLLIVWGQRSLSPTPVTLPGNAPADEILMGMETLFARSTDGLWSASGGGWCGLPFGTRDQVRDLRPLTDGGLPPHSVPACSFNSRFALYLEGRAAQAVARRSNGWLTEQEAGVMRRGWTPASVAYAAAITIAISDATLLAECAGKYLRNMLPRCLLELSSGARLLLRPAATAQTAVRRDSALECEGGASFEVEEVDRQDAQQVAAGVSLADFCKHAQIRANAEYPSAPEICKGAVVRASAVDTATGEFVSRSPVPELPIGELAEVTADPGGGEVEVVVVSPDGAESRVSVPTSALSCIVSRLQVLQWVRDFPGRWEREMDDSTEFRAVDVNCEPQLTHDNRRPGNKTPHFCCMRRSIEFVAGRMLAHLTDGNAEWVGPIRAFLDHSGDTDSLQDGIAAAHIFSLEILNPRSKKPRKTQMYSILNEAMRQSWNDQLKPGTDAAKRLDLFAPLIVHLHNFTDGMARTVKHGIVFRGMNAIVAQGYKPGADFVWGCFSSTAENSKVAQKFNSGVGTLFVLRERRAAPISFCSMFPGESERVLPPTMFRVLTRMPETTLCVAETRSDIVIAEEQSADDPRMPQEDADSEAEAGVLLRLKAHSNSAFIYKMFIGRFVEPRLLVDGGMTKLFEHFEGAGQRNRVALLRGDGGTGKTSVLLAVLCHILEKDPAQRRETPIFVHCPWARGLLTDEQPALRPIGSASDASECRVGPIVHALCAALAIRSESELAALKRQHIIVLLDSLDECATCEEPGRLLRKMPLLPRGGVVAEDWPHARFIICCRKEYLDLHNITPRDLDEGKVAVCDVQPFEAGEREQYVAKLAAQEVGKLEGRLAKVDDAARCLDDMHCVPCTTEAAKALGAASATVKRAAAEVKSANADRKQAAEAAEADAKAALAKAKKVAERQCAQGVDAVLGSLPSGLLSNPFVLFLACSASHELSGTDLRIAPRYKIYDAWVHLDVANRVARVPELASAMPAAPDRIDRLVDAASALAVGMYAQGRWQATVGDCVEILGGGDAARAVLSVLPLRLESAQRDACCVTWRHRTVQEFAIARAVLLPGRTSNAVWTAALTGPLSKSPESQGFISDGWETLSKRQADLLRASLGDSPVPFR